MRNPKSKKTSSRTRNAVSMCTHLTYCRAETVRIFKYCQDHFGKRRAFPHRNFACLQKSEAWAVNGELETPLYYSKVRRLGTLKGEGF
jgi:hypothetical protein